MQISKLHRQPLSLAVSAAVALAASGFAYGQESETSSTGDLVAPTIEEVLVLGRMRSSAQDIVEERMDQPFAADLLGSEQISRTGDSTVAAALMRVTGVTLLDDKYVYVRSLGERYSTTLLNGASVPSPELTRNVLPLDLIPASIVESLKIQKAWSPDLPANFGGGNIDIRTKSIPDDFVLRLELGVETNSLNRDDGLTFTRPEGDGLPEPIRNALDTYAGGTLTVEQNRQRGNISQAEASEINRDLALSLNRDIHIGRERIPLDFEGTIDLGNSWDLGDDFTFGSLISLSQEQTTRNRNQIQRGVGAPEATYSEAERTTEERRQLASLNLGLSYQDQHTISANGYRITGEDLEAQITTGHDPNYQASEGRQYVDYRTRLEERELLVGQLLGEHSFDQLSGNVLGDVRVDWFISQSKATTDIPHLAEVQGINLLEPESGELVSTALLSSTSVASFSFLNLDDEVRSRGWNVHVPLAFDRTELTLSGGYRYDDKAREYYGYTANINAVGVSSDLLSGTPGRVLGDANIGDPINGFNLSMGTGLGQESYMAAQITDSAYGMLDLTWNYQWRLTAGARHESFRQALLPIDLLNYASVGELIEDLQQEDQAFASEADDWYPSVALTFMNEGFMNTDTFQVRASYSQTLVRPDLREVSEVSYIDPELGIRVQGNPNLVVSELDHIDLRSEWFYANGDNFTVSLFYKDIANPIEQSRKPGSDDNIELVFFNAESGEIYGIEMEGLKSLGAGFFVSSNITLSQSEIVSPAGDGYTNPERSMTGQSDYVVNTQLGYDSDDGMHSASLVYNVFGERVYYAARGTGYDDAFEQPFHSLNLVYSFFPTDSITAKLKLTNLLNEERTFEQEDANGRSVTILEQEVGTGVGLEVSYSF